MHLLSVLLLDVHGGAGQGVVAAVKVGAQYKVVRDFSFIDLVVSN